MISIVFGALIGAVIAYSMDELHPMFRLLAVVICAGILYAGAEEFTDNSFWEAKE